MDLVQKADTLPAEPDETPAVHTRASWYAVFVLVIAAAFASLDRAAIPLQAEKIRASLELSDTQLGLLQDTGIAIFTAIAAYPIAWLSDRYDRRLVLGGCVIVWSLAIVLCGLARDFNELFAATALLGAGGAGLTPISMAVIAVLFVGKKRYFANSVYIFFLGIGGALAMMAGGFLIEAIDQRHAAAPIVFDAGDSWRVVFLVVSMSAPALLLLIATLPRIGKKNSMPEPGLAIVADAPPLVTVSGYVKDRLSIFLRMYGAISLFILGQAAISTWIFVILSRSFGQTPAQIGSGIGTSALLASPIGLLLSAASTRWLLPRLGVTLPVYLMGFAAVIVGIATLLMAAAQSALHLYILFFIANISIVTGGMSSPGLIQNIGVPSIMARLFAIMSICSTAFAAIAGPLVGALSDRMKDVEHGLLIAAVIVAAPAFFASALLFLTSPRAFRKATEAAMSNQ